MDIEVPILNVLRDRGGPTLMKVRESDAAATYFAALAQWRHKSSEKNRDRLLESLDEYTRFINRSMEAKGFVDVVKAQIMTWESLKELAEVLLGQGAMFVLDGSAGGAIASGIVAAGRALVLRAKESSGTHMARLGVRLRPEVTELGGGHDVLV